ncbi:hypothetical protein LOTGIDRAFT_152529 [Lottia gigantea]|uniref:C-type lectin domain-containing protein n=1 Tax=Lottia gigantea TaxID=225164 RepID=V4BCZ2_LOTGI|nr:hypothetical protein LOTGIDRAFT_152529 [Lottia gigantea]ESP05661.1 hypothetical protein LOTGIDRAFT_152529 [Lottia gigantea]
MSRRQYFQIVFLLLLCVCTIQSLDRRFTAIRFPPMEGLMPQADPLLNVKTKIGCAMFCVQDETCACISYNKFDSFCMLVPEPATNFEKSTNISIMPHLYHFNVHEVRIDTKEILTQGYRWHEAHQTALRFHYSRPKNNTESIQLCQQEGGDLVTLQTESKLNTIVRILNSNTKLASAGKHFYYNPTTDTGLPSPPMCSVLTKSGTFEEVTCDTTIPYICER